MSGFDYPDDTQNHSDEPDWLKDLRRKAKDYSKLEQEINDLRKAQRGSTVKSVLEAKGVNPKIAGLIPADVEATEDAVGKWLADYGDIFGVTTSKDPEPKADDVSENTSVQNQGLTPEMAKLLAAVTGSDAGSVNIDADTQAAAVLNSIGQNAKSSQDYFSSLRNGG